MKRISMWALLLLGMLGLGANLEAHAQVADPAPQSDVVLSSFKGTNLGWWGKINTGGVSVRKGPSDSSKRLGSFSMINRVKVLDEVPGDNGTWYKIDGGDFPGGYVFSKFITPISQPMPDVNAKAPEGVSSSDYWIDVNIAKETLTLYQSDKPVFSTYVSTGRKARSTMAGTFRVWEKLQKTRMHGGPPWTDHVYDLANVPYVMYYSGSFAVHGTYWHDKFGSPQSAGCTNVTQGDAKFLFDRVSVGTVVNNHY